MDPTPSHQDYRPGATAPPTPLLDSVKTSWLVAFGLAVVMVIGLIVLHSGGDTPATPTATQVCAAAWEENKGNGYNLFRTRAEYMANCTEFEQIRKDHR